MEGRNSTSNCGGLLLTLTFPGECPALAKELWHSGFGKLPRKAGRRTDHMCDAFTFFSMLGNLCIMIVTNRTIQRLRSCLRDVPYPVYLSSSIRDFQSHFHCLPSKFWLLREAIAHVDKRCTKGQCCLPSLIENERPLDTLSLQTTVCVKMIPLQGKMSHKENSCEFFTVNPNHNWKHWF